MSSLFEHLKSVDNKFQTDKQKANKPIHHLMVLLRDEVNWSNCWETFLVCLCCSQHLVKGLYGINSVNVDDCAICYTTDLAQKNILGNLLNSEGERFRRCVKRRPSEFSSLLSRRAIPTTIIAMYRGKGTSTTTAQHCNNSVSCQMQTTCWCIPCHNHANSLPIFTLGSNKLVKALIFHWHSLI